LGGTIPVRFPSEEARYVSPEHSKSNYGLWSPGPGVYTGKPSSFGTQKDSKNSSAPSFSFGSSSRSHQSKRFLGTDHAKKEVGLGFSPGPSYSHRTDRKGGGTIGDSPSFSFGTSGRPGEHSKSKEKDNLPAPGSYDSTSAFGRQNLSKSRTIPAYGFGSCKRDGETKRFVSKSHSKSRFGELSPGPCEYSPTRDTKGSYFGDAPRFTFHGDRVKPGRMEKEVFETPGPGQYDSYSSVGNQKYSTKKTQPSYGFGTSNRDKQTKVFLSKEHVTDNLGKGSPGPAAYNHTESIGKQTLARNTSAPAYTLGGP